MEIKSIKKMYWKIITIGILIIGITSCQTEKPIEKIEFQIEEFTIKSNLKDNFKIGI